MTIQALPEQLQRYMTYLVQDECNVNLWLSISEGFQELGDWASAQHYLDGAKVHAEQPLWCQQGFIYLRSNQIMLAKEAFTLALAEEDTPINRYYLSFCLYSNHEFNQALTVLKSLETPDPIELSSKARLLKAKILHHLHRHDDAITVLEQSMTHHESDADAAGLLALLYFDKSDAEKAELFTNKALALDPSNYQGQLVQILLKTRLNKITLAEIEQLLATNPQDGRLLFALGTTQMRHMNVSAAEQAFFQTSEIWPEFYENWISYGWCHLLQNNLDKAEQAYQQAVTIDANSADGWGGLALVSALNNHLPLAEQSLEKAQTLDSACFLAAITRIIVANQTDLKQAAKEFNKALPDVAGEVNQMLSKAPLFKGLQTPTSMSIH